MNSKITQDHLGRRAIIYVRQSTSSQVISNHESQKRQYALKHSAGALGFRNVEVIDEDLGRSGSGTVERPGFQRLVGAVCAEEVGAIFCIEASRLARNGRDWHLLIDLCALLGTLVIDLDGVYDPKLINDRLLLGIKGTMSEFELHLLRQRSREALDAKAKRGELEIGLPVGFCWADGLVDLDPDRRVQEVIRMVFQKFQEFRSVRQSLLWFLDEALFLPVRNRALHGSEVHWRIAVYHRLHSILTSPVYAGAYSYGRTESRTQVIDGTPRKTEGHRKSRDRWSVLIRDHHPGYLSWDQYEENQRILADNAHVKKDSGRKSGRGGKALLVGLLRCRRCGRRLRVRYSGTDGEQHRYTCKGDELRGDRAFCLAIGGIRTDRAVGLEILKAVEPHAIEATLAERRYERCDPDNRLVADELEARWNAALERVTELEQALAGATLVSSTAEGPDRESLLALAANLPAVWNAPSTEASMKQRIAAILIQEVVVDVDEEADESALVIHWSGGRHSDLRLPRRSTGRQPRTDLEAVEVVQRMAGRWPDKEIASTLNRLQLKTESQKHWTQVRVRALCHRHGFAGFDPSAQRSTEVNLITAATHLGVGPWVVRKLIRLKILKADQVVPYGPWEIRIADLDSNEVREAAERTRDRRPLPRLPASHSKGTSLPGFHHEVHNVE
jgi:DNA invertase Pin-like site-specific DNA recombinase